MSNAMSNASIRQGIRDLARERWLNNHPHADQYKVLLDKNDSWLDGYFSSCNTVRGARRVASAYVARQYELHTPYVRPEPDEERILMNELAGGLSIKRGELCF